MAEDLPHLLDKHRSDLLRWVAQHARGLLRHEAADDVVQGIHLRAVRQGSQFQYRGDREFLGWLFLVARQYVGDRHDYWSALRRQAGRMLRTASTGSPADTSAGRGVNPESGTIGPSTYASRRELVELATRAMNTLLARDQELIRCAVQGLGNAEIAERLHLSYDAAEQAKRRALERFRKTVELLSRGRAR